MKFLAHYRRDRIKWPMLVALVSMVVVLQMHWRGIGDLGQGRSRNFTDRIASLGCPGFVDSTDEDYPSASEIACVWARCISPFGTFSGKEEIKRYFEWQNETMPDL